jgi:UDP-3-O-[3-hydroxymyristoyl] glucosamine N-acyltransferase
MDTGRTATLAELAELVGGAVRGDGNVRVTAAKPLDDARTGHITLIDLPERIAQLEACSATAVVLPRNVEYGGRPAIAVDNLHQSFRIIFARLHPPRQQRRVGIHPAAVISPKARIADRVEIHPFAVIGDDVQIGPGSVIHGGVQIMAGCRIGRDATIFSNAILYEDCHLGDRVLIHGGAVIGSYGFGYNTNENKHELSAQLGNVILEDDVEIGANSTVDRGAYGSTLIGKGTKIDNLVQIAHNCRIGQHNIICAQVGIAGSTSTGDYVVMAGQVGVRDHVHIGEHTVICAQAGVTNDVPARVVMLGAPATTEREQKFRLAAVAKLPDMRREMRALRRTVEELQQLLAHTTDPTFDAQDHAA